MKSKAVYITQSVAACGIGQIGDIFAQGLLNHPNYDFSLYYTNNLDEILQILRDVDPLVAIYNYSPVSTPWIDDKSIRSTEFEHILHIRMMHDVNQTMIDYYDPKHDHGWIYNFTSDHMLKGSQYFFPVTRMSPPLPTVEYKETDIPIIGFQGFLFPHKGVFRLVDQVMKEFDRAILRMHTPFAHFGDIDGQNTLLYLKQIKSILSQKPGIELISTTDFLSSQDTVNLLATNTINCYLYDYNDGIALSSSVDFALAARRPIAVSKSHQMRNVWNLTPSILIEENSLKEIIANGIEPLKPLYEKYSQESFYQDFDKGIKYFLQKKWSEL